MLRYSTSLASELPREWRCDASSCTFVTGGAAIRVLSLSTDEAALLTDAKAQAEALYCDLYDLAKFPAARAKQAVLRGFHVPNDPTEAVRPARTVLVYYDAKPDSPSDRLTAYTQVAYDGEYVSVASIAVSSTLSEDVQHQVLRATVLATEELAMEMARNADKLDMIWRGQLGASAFLKGLFESDGYSTKIDDRVKRTAKLQELGNADDEIAFELVVGRRIDL